MYLSSPHIDCIRSFTLILILLTAVLPSSLEANSIKVCPDCTISSIKEGIKKAQPYDTIYIEAGSYYESEINVNKPLVIIGQEDPVVDGGGENGIFIVTSDSVQIHQLIIRNVQANYLEEIAGIRIRESSYFLIQNNVFENTFFAIYLEHAEDGIVRDNIMRGEAVEEASSGNAIHAWYCENILVKGNEAFGHRDGIYFEFVDSSKVINV